MKGRGLKFYAKLQTETEFVRVKPIKGYNQGEESGSTSDKSYLDQDNDYMDHDAGMIDPGEASVTVEFDDADAGQILLEGNLGKVLDFKVEWKGGATSTYSGTLTKRGFTEPNDEDIQRSYSIKRKAAAPVYTAAP